MTRRFPARARAFTLIELSIVVLVLGLITAAAMRYVNTMADANALTATNANLDVVETALQNFRNTFGRLPCPADLTLAENTSNFGTEIYSSSGGTSTVLGDGKCGYSSSSNLNAAYGYAVPGMYINTSLDPDAAAGSDNNYAGAVDPLYDSTNAPSNVVQGAIPTKTLKIADKYAYDSWGNKIFYAVDRRITATSAFTTYSISNTSIGEVVIKNIPNTPSANPIYASTSTLANALTYKAIYALVSTGKNGHGGFARNLTGTSTPFNAGSTNTDELDNCHCSSSAAPTAFNRIFVQKPKTIDSTSFTDNFDDVVRFKTRLQMANYAETQ